MKHTEVNDRNSLLANTFLRPFRPIEGMSRLYRSWEASGASFHYVSSSPWQLFRPLAQLCDDDSFPAGSFHLRSFRLRDHMLRKLFRIRRHGKMSVIKSILLAFPDRQFILVGDSGEKDPEIYGSLARKFSDQIVAILIRQFPARPLDPLRCATAFRDVAPDRWRLFDSPDQLVGFSPTTWGQVPLATST